MLSHNVQGVRLQKRHTLRTNSDGPLLNVLNLRRCRQRSISSSHAVTESPPVIERVLVPRMVLIEHQLNCVWLPAACQPYRPRHVIESLRTDVKNSQPKSGRLGQSETK